MPIATTTEAICDYHWGERGSLVFDWGSMSSYLLRIDGCLYTFSFCEPRWFLWKRLPDGTWERGASGPMIRPPLLFADPQGHLHIICAGVHWTSTAPGDHHHLTASALPSECGTMIYTNAAINATGDLLLVFVNPAEEYQILTAFLPSGTDTWQVAELCRLPVRYCYPQIHLVGHAAHVFIVEDEHVHDPNARWGPNSGYYYRFRELIYLHCPDITTGTWQHPVRVHQQDDGSLRTLDICALPDGSVHLLYWGYDRSANGGPAPGHNSQLTHAIAPSPGAPFTHHPIATGTVRTGNFLPDGQGGWHYLYGRAIDERYHPYVGYLQTTCAHLYQHRAADLSLSTPTQLDTSPARPSVPHLLRPHSGGQPSPPNTLETIWEDPWDPGEGTTCNRTLYYSQIHLT